MKNSKDLTYNQVKIGDRFEHETSKYDPYPTLVDVTEIVEVVDIKTTPAGRITLYTSRGKWTNGPCAPTSKLAN